MVRVLYQRVIIWQQAVAKLGDANGQQAVAQISEDVFFSVPWGHHLYIMSQCKDVERAVFYLKKTVENGWSRAVLLNFFDTNLYERQGKAVNNFSRLLADPQSQLASPNITSRSSCLKTYKANCQQLKILKQCCLA